MELASGDYWSYGYDKMGQVRYAAKYQSGGAGLPGYAFGLPFVDGFTYDDIGNRTSAIGGDTDLTSSYFAEAGASGANGANALNQPGSRSVPRMLAVRGVAETDASVTVDGQNVNGRVGEYYYGETSVDDDLAHWLAVEVEGRLSGGGYLGSDRVAREIDEQFIAANPENFVYDADGNLASDGRWSYTWDAENRLTGMATLASAVNVGVPDYRLGYRYDSRGRMFERKVYRDNLLESTDRYLWNGYNQIAQFDDAGAMQQSYLWGLDLSGSMQGAGGVGGLLAVTDAASGTTAYPYYDGNGNVMGYVDAADGREVATFEYGPFGEPLRATGSLADDLAFRFSTKPTDDVTGHVHYQLRVYDPLNGRWLSRDPIGENGGLNLYGMVGNDPVNLWDYLGLKWKKVNCIDISVDYSNGAYAGVGGSVMAGVRGERCDCCNSDTGEFKEGEFIDVSVTGSAEIGVGLGTQVEVFNMRVGFVLKGPSASSSISAGGGRQCDGTISGGAKKEYAYNYGGGLQGGIGMVSFAGSYSIGGKLSLGILVESEGIYFTVDKNFYSNGRVEFALGPVKVGRNFANEEEPADEPRKDLIYGF